MSFQWAPNYTLTGRELVWMVASYLVGCFTAGYYWTRWRAGQDIRQFGSGNVGARNVGRVLGAGGFTVTFLLDLAKGALAVAAALWLGLRPEAVVASMVAVVVGHNWPAFALGPLAVFLCGLDKVEVAAMSFLAILVLIAHRKNIREEIARIAGHRTVKERPIQMDKGPNDEL